MLTFWVAVAKAEGSAEITTFNSVGVGVTQYDGITYCCMFVGIPNSVNFYA